MTEQKQITLKEALNLVDFEFVDGAWRVKRIAGGFIDMRNLMTEQPMNDQITLEEALKLVEFQKDCLGKWYVRAVRGDCELVEGDCGIVVGNCDIVKGNCHVVEGTVYQTISNRNWQYVETPKERFERLLGETENKELIEAFNQLEDN